VNGGLNVQRSAAGLMGVMSNIRAFRQKKS